MAPLSTPLLANRYDTHLARKAWHIFTGVVGLTVHFAFELSPGLTARGLLLIALLGFLVDFTRLKWESLNRIAVFLMKPFMRESERSGLSGLPFYALGASVSLFLFPEPVAILSILFLIFADPIASYVGITLGSKKIWGSKTLEGFFAAYGVCFCTSLIYGVLVLPAHLNLLVFSLLAGLTGALAELLSTKIDDNLSIPVLSGLGLWALNALMNFV